MKCFYHNDMDGRCAASIVSAFEFMRNADSRNKDSYFEVDYSKPLPDVVGKDELVYIVDYSFTEPTLNQLENILSKTKNVVWCDHHTSTFKLIENHPELDNISGIRRDDVSGAALIYMFLYDYNPEYLPEYIKLVSDYDCWLFRYGDRTTYFKLGLESNPFDALDVVWRALLSESVNPRRLTFLEEIIEKGKAIKAYIDIENEYYLNHFGFESVLDGVPCYVVNRKTNSWIFGDKYNEYPLCVTIVFDGAKYTYTLYSSKDDIDCSKIAEKHGGGGHKGAAGFVIDDLILTKTEGLKKSADSLKETSIDVYNKDGTFRKLSEIIIDITNIWNNNK